LELPWADVFTTNYDRLLEKTNSLLWKRHYDIVSNVSDLPLARRPRIVKLHGSLPSLEHLVLTEEDYRSYRRNYAPFVANVRRPRTGGFLAGAE
jgi:NAD-dependent SIR2 family protein deacetylase